VLGVDAIASGTITDLGTSVKVNARLISAESGKLFSVASVEIPKNDKVKILLSQSIATATVAGATTSGTGGAEKTAKPAAVKNQVVTRGSFKYELLEIRADGERVTCKIKLSNPGENDAEFRLWGFERENSIIYDNFGNEYYLKTIKYANKLCDNWVHDCTKTIIAGTSINIELYFDNEGISPKNSTKITLLQLIGQEGWGGTPGIKVQFRNIPIIKE